MLRSIPQTSFLTLALLAFAVACGGSEEQIAKPIVDGLPTSSSKSVVRLKGDKPANTGLLINGKVVVKNDESTEFDLYATLVGGNNLLTFQFRTAEGKLSAPSNHFILYTPDLVVNPRLITPQPSDLIATFFPTFSWASAGQEKGKELFAYRLDIASDRSFTTQAQSYLVGTALNFTPTTPVPAGKVYWRLCTTPLGVGPETAGGCSLTRFFFSGRNPSDLNGDNFGDLALGAPQNDYFDFNSGSVKLTYGSMNPAQNGTDVRLIGKIYNGNFGAALAQGLDFNQDGIGDLLVGEPGDNVDVSPLNPSSGAVHLFLGGAVFPQLAQTTRIAPAGYQGYGRSLAVLGDYQNDELDDFAVGAPESSNGGKVDIFCGATLASIPSTPCLTLTRDPNSGTQTSKDLFGKSLARIGDINGDSYGDLAVGAPGVFERGAVYIYFGGPLADATADITIIGNQDGEQFGATLAGGMDFNADGFSDLAIGGRGTNQRGEVLLVFGGQGSGMYNAEHLNALRIKGKSSKDRFGASLLFTPNSLNNGEIHTESDLLIGAPGWGSDQGAIYDLTGTPVIAAEPGLTNASPAVKSDFKNDELGASLTYVTHFTDGEGTLLTLTLLQDSIAAGAPGAALDPQISGLQTGRVDLLSAIGLNSFLQIHGEEHLDRFGASLGCFR